MTPTTTDAGITLTLPLPPRGCSSNGSHGHWRVAAKARADYRAECAWSAALAPLLHRRTPTRRRVSLVFCIKGGRKAERYQPRDPSNGVSAAKGLFDGLVDAGWLVDDSQKFMQLGAVSIDSTRGPFVEVVITEVTP